MADEKRGPRRARRPGARGSDPTPAKLPPRESAPDSAAELNRDSNDERLRADRPPHWG